MIVFADVNLPLARYDKPTVGNIIVLMDLKNLLHSWQLSGSLCAVIYWQQIHVDAISYVFRLLIFTWAMVVNSV
jgi:hypothetical protein